MLFIYFTLFIRGFFHPGVLISITHTKRLHVIYRMGSDIASFHLLNTILDIVNI